MIAVIIITCVASSPAFARGAHEALPGAKAPGYLLSTSGRGAVAREQPQPGLPSPAQPVPPRVALPSLDELLGLEPEAGDQPDDPLILPPDPDHQALEQQLTQGEMAQTLEQAVDLMGQTAERITGSRDVGITTQRLQEDILARLDAVITAAEQQQNSGSSSSSSSSSEQQQQQQQANQPGQQSQGEEQSEGDPSQGENQQEGTPPGGRDGALAPPVAPDGGVWGRLPPRLRDSLVQGSSDTFSSLYRRLTELYYQRLAEEERR